MSIGFRLAPRSAGDAFRAARFARCHALILRVIAERGRCRVADIGGGLHYWQVCAPDLLEHPGFELDLFNVAYEPRDHEALEAIGKERIRLLTGDARALPQIGDASYDLAHSNSVIEHVGQWPQMQAMAAETRRIARIHYVQTPYWGFPLEPHFRAPLFHWLPEQWRLRLVMRFRLGFATRASSVDQAMRLVQSAVLLDRRQFGALFPEANIHSEIVYGLTKSLIALGGEGIAPDAGSNRRRLRI